MPAFLRIPGQTPIILIANQTADCKRALRLAEMTELESRWRWVAASPEALHTWEFWKFSNKSVCPFPESLAQALALCSERPTRTGFLYAICAILEGACEFAIFCAFIRGNPAPASEEKIASVNSVQDLVSSRIDGRALYSNVHRGYGLGHWSALRIFVRTY